MIRTESCTGLGGSTQRLHQKEIKVLVLFLTELLELEGETDDPDPRSEGSR